MQITIEKARVVVTEGNETLGEMTFVNSNEKFYIIDHTGVSNAARGLGLGKKMVQTFVEHARLNNMKVLPLCPFAKAEFEKNLESYADVLM
ncbi:MAG: GNAT family N-acetyltransferase [Bacillaceae bacterium]